MFPAIIDEFSSDSGTKTYALSNGRIVAPFELSFFDTESPHLVESESGLQQFLQSLHPRALCRFILQSNPSSGSADGALYSRKAAVEGMGFVENRLFAIVEMDGGGWKDLAGLLRRAGPQPLAARASELAGSFDFQAVEAAGLRVKAVAKAELQAILPQAASTHVTKLSYGLDLGDRVVGVVRLVRLGSTPLTPLVLAQLKDRLPLPYSLRVSVRRLPSERAEALLRRKSAQVRSSTDTIGAHKHSEAEMKLSDVALLGSSLFEFEFLLEFSRLDEKSLRADMAEAVQTIKALGDFAFETVGAFPSFLAGQIGFDQHVSLLETEQVLPCFLPVFTAGESPSFRSEISPRALATLRRDESLDFFDVFNSRYDNYSVCIFGKSGRGKSVLTNLLTRALHHDPDVRIIKVDVGGSHSKETELLGGEEFRLSLKEPSGINPFSVFATMEHNEDACNIIASFLGVLLMEEGEKSLTKQMRSEIEREVTQYSLSRPATPSLDDFYNAAKGLPRRSLLSRWVTGGVYGNAFRERAGEQQTVVSCRVGVGRGRKRGNRSASEFAPDVNVPSPGSRVPSSRAQARDNSEKSETSQRLSPSGIEGSKRSIADRKAVKSQDTTGWDADEANHIGGRSLATLRDRAGSGGDCMVDHEPAQEALSRTRLRYFNFSDVFQAGDPDYGQGGLAAVMAMFNLQLLQDRSMKHVFIADETPFFVERCFQFFKFSTANVRKYGGSFITIEQKSSDVIINGDTGILDNSNTKFLFSIDGTKDGFTKRLKLDSEIVDRVESLQSEKAKFSEVLLSDGLGTKVLRITLSPEEYWSMTSSQDDNRRLADLQRSVPGLSLQKAIAVLGGST